jgi:predicted ATP-grasp superfamily ATP-dependent carboligase
MIGILYEHPEWFKPLFAEMDRRGLRYDPILAHEHSYDPSATGSSYSLVVNRMSPSAYLRGHGHAIMYAGQYLSHLEELGVPVVNGTPAYDLELSKAKQLTLLAKLGLPHPRSRVVNSVAAINRAAAELEYPLIVKPNIGGSGALMLRFDSPSELRAAEGLEAVFGIDQTAILQEYHPPRGGSIVRVEALDNQFLYAIRIYNDPSQGFNLCPADICQVDGDNCPVDASKAGKKIEVADPPAWVVAGVLEVFRAGGLDVGGVEYLESERDGQLYLYDVNALSNFVTDAPRLVGFDPFEKLVDFLEARATVIV